VHTNIDAIRFGDRKGDRCVFLSVSGKSGGQIYNFACDGNATCETYGEICSLDRMAQVKCNLNKSKLPNILARRRTNMLLQHKPMQRTNGRNTAIQSRW
jgi:hypothetical protein